eukprot:514665-Rhodomonas_salina.3
MAHTGARTHLVRRALSVQCRGGRAEYLRTGCLLPGNGGLQCVCSSGGGTGRELVFGGRGKCLAGRGAVTEGSPGGGLLQVGGEEGVQATDAAHSPGLRSRGTGRARFVSHDLVQ